MYAREEVVGGCDDFDGFIIIDHPSSCRKVFPSPDVNLSEIGKATYGTGCHHRGQIVDWKAVGLEYVYCHTSRTLPDDAFLNKKV